MPTDDVANIEKLVRPQGVCRVTFNLVPFGAGRNMCPGRYFARNEFKLVVATILRGYDLDLLSHQLPGLTYARFGLGTPPPLKDVPFRIAAAS